MPEQYRSPLARPYIPGPIGVAVGLAPLAEPVVAATNGGNPLVPDAIEGLGDGLARAGAWAGNRDNWIRVAKVVAGAGMVLVGLAKLTAPATTAVVGAVAPVGKAAKVAGKVLK